MRRLPRPADHRLGDGGDSRGSLRIVSGLAENTNSIFGADSSEFQTATGCPVLLESRNHQPRGKRAQPSIPIRPTRSPARGPKTRAFLLTKTYLEGGDRPHFELAFAFHPVFGRHRLAQRCQPTVGILSAGGAFLCIHRLPQ